MYARWANYRRRFGSRKEMIRGICCQIFLDQRKSAYISKTLDKSWVFIFQVKLLLETVPCEKTHCQFPYFNSQLPSSSAVALLLCIAKVLGSILGGSKVCLETFFKIQWKIAFFKRAFQGFCTFQKGWDWYISILSLPSYTRKKFSLGLDFGWALFASSCPRRHVKF